MLRMPAMQEILARSLVQEETNADRTITAASTTESTHAVTEAGAPRACAAPAKPLATKPTRQPEEQPPLRLEKAHVQRQDSAQPPPVPQKRPRIRSE